MLNNDILKNISNCDIDNDKIVVRDNVHDIIKSVSADYGFNMLKNITAIDKKEETELIYHLFSPDNNEDLKISATVRGEAETVTDIFKSAVAEENEIYDLFGIKFIGNDNLKRLYMPEDWEGFPLRKDYIQSDTRLAWNDDNDTQT